MTALATLANVTAWAVAAYLILSGARLSLGCERTLRRLRAAPAPDRPPNADVQIVLLLPMLREQTIVERALRQFVPVMRAGVTLDVVVACTRREAEERERLGLDREGGTCAVATRVCAALNVEVGREAFFVVEAPAEARGRAGQMNAAFTWWTSRRPADTRDVYVGVYDADSTPDPAVFPALLHIVGDRRRTGAASPAILQQVSCYCQNIDELSGIAGAVSVADALAQTRWALGFELPLYERYARSVRERTLRRLVYCVGHGCFVSQATLQRIGGFPTCSPNDDLALGYLASLAGLEVVPLPVLDYCDVAPHPLATIRQSRFWYLGSARFHRDLAYFGNRFALRPALVQRLWLHADGRLRNFFWAWRGALWLAALAFAVATRAWPLTFALVAAHLTYVQLGLVHTVFTLHRLPGAPRVPAERLAWSRLSLAAAAASAAFMLRGVGPLTASLNIGTTAEWKQER